MVEETQERGEIPTKSQLDDFSSILQSTRAMCSLLCGETWMRSVWDVAGLDER